jgi:hypothetical protein
VERRRSPLVQTAICCRIVRAVIGALFYVFWFVFGLATGWIPRVGMAIAVFVPVVLIGVMWATTADDPQGLAGDAGTPAALGVFLILTSTSFSALGAWCVKRLQQHRTI